MAVDYFHLKLTPDALGSISVLGLAHMGDSVFEILVRGWLCAHGRETSANLHRATVSYVSAPAQARLVDRLLPLLTEEEQGYYRRGRNAHVHAVPKNATAGEYGKATGLECLLGALWLSGRTERINELFCAVMEEENAV